MVARDIIERIVHLKSGLPGHCPSMLTDVESSLFRDDKPQQISPTSYPVFKHGILWRDPSAHLSQKTIAKSVLLRVREPSEIPTAGVSLIKIFCTTLACTRHVSSPLNYPQSQLYGQPPTKAQCFPPGNNQEKKSVSMKG
jgi:hypothetical protein